MKDSIIFAGLGCLALGLTLYFLNAGAKMRVKIPHYIVDQQLRQELFKSCLDSSKNQLYDEWTEVIDSCDDSAYYQAKKCVRNCTGKN